MIKAVKKSIDLSLLSVMVLVAMEQVHAIPATNKLPNGGVVISGSASFNRSIVNRLIVNQQSDKLFIRWNEFDVGSKARVSFKQPGSSSIVLNQIVNGNPTEIWGAIDANGQLLMVNPEGITFGAGSQIRAASIVASALNVEYSSFNSNSMVFSDGADGNVAVGAIDNRGTMISSAGPVILLGREVYNSGRLWAKAGDVTLAVPQRASLAANQLSILPSSSFRKFPIVSSSGMLQASAINTVGGKVLLLSDPSKDVSWLRLSGKVLADHSLTVSGSSIDVGNLNSNNNTSLNAATIRFDGVLNMQRSNSILDVTGDYKLAADAKINLIGATPQFRVNGETYKVIKTPQQLQFLNSNATTLSTKYVLINDIDASATATWNDNAGFKPIGSIARPFSGVLEGLGHRVAGLRINRPTEDAALFGYTQNASIRNLDLSNVSIYGYSAAGLAYSSTGGETLNNSVTGNIFAKVRIAEASAYQRTSLAAGLIGINSSTVIGNQVDANVTSAGHQYSFFNSPAGIAGGLIGINTNTVADNLVAGTVTGQYKVGGLIGENSSSVYDNASGANVIASKPLNPASPRGFIGALIGEDTGDTFNNTSTGTVTVR